MTTITEPSGKCVHCDQWHQGPCPRVRAIEYYQNGSIKRVEYRDGGRQYRDPEPSYRGTVTITHPVAT